MVSFPSRHNGSRVLLIQRRPAVLVFLQDYVEALQKVSQLGLKERQ